MSVSVHKHSLHLLLSVIKLLQEVKKHYKSKRAKKGSHLHIEFKDDKISLNIPIQGVSIKQWKLTPLATPTVSQILNVESPLFRLCIPYYAI